MRKLIVTILVLIILYKAAEPLAYCIMVNAARISISKNIQKVLDHYNDEDQVDQMADNFEQVKDLENYQIARQKKNKTFNLALNGNRLNTRLETKYNNSLKDLLHKNSETPKSGSFSLVDLGFTFLCPGYKMYEIKSYTVNNKNNWYYSSSLIPHIQSIPVPPPQLFPA